MGIRPQELLRKNPFYYADSLDVYGGRMNEFLIDNIQREQHPMFIDIQPHVDYPWAISIKVKGDPQTAFNTVADVYHTAFHKVMTDDDAKYADRIIQDKFHQEQQTSHLVALFAFMAILISLLGLVAMATYYIGQRAKEIAIRKVFGSTGASGPPTSHPHVHAVCRHRFRHRQPADGVAHAALDVTVQLPCRLVAVDSRGWCCGVRRQSSRRVRAEPGRPATRTR